MPVIGTVQCLWIVEFAEPKCYLKAIGLFSAQIEFVLNEGQRIYELALIN